MAQSENSDRIAELNALVETIRERVRTRYPRPEDAPNGFGAPGSGAPPLVRVPLADLMPIVHARDAAQAKIAAIGSVNPRTGGPVNRIIQTLKKTIARGLQWFVRDQVAFNRESVAAIEAVIEALNEHNRVLVSLASQVNEQLGGFTSAHAAIGAEIGELKDIRHHWIEWRAEWERKLSVNEVQFLRATADLQGAFQHRVTLIESNFREIVKAQHVDYLGALDRATTDIQKRLWSDLERIRAEYARLIHDELRIIRLRAGKSAPTAASQAPSPPPLFAAPPAPALEETLDITRFAYRFRGSEEDVRRGQEFYKPYFRKRRSVLDIGCGRGEFLEMMRDIGVEARGIDLGEESVAQCREKDLTAEVADLFSYLPAHTGEFDGIILSQVVEHLDPMRLPEVIRLCADALEPGGILAVETPNPECLAIFATHFFLDPTHTRPVPYPLMEFYMEEAGLGSIEVHKLAPAVESMPEIASLPEAFRQRFFDGLDYAIIGRKS
jgi:O-antigen chain-terminating methyltransferase